jgi:hypothetical protein
MPLSFAGAMSSSHRADAWGCCADDPVTLLLAIFHRMGQGLLVVKHRAEIAHVDAAFKEVKLYNPPRDQSRLSSHHIRV